MSDKITFRVFDEVSARIVYRWFSAPELLLSGVYKYFGSKQLDRGILKSLKSNKTYREHNCTEILQGTNFPSQSRFTGNSLIDTVVLCYNHHHNLTLRPDDIWTAIITQFSFFVNKHAERFRDKFVKHEGMKELVVVLPESLRSADYGLFVKLMSEKIDENLVDPEFKKWILPAFSTTTDEDLITCGIVFMAAMKRYFEFGCKFLCGIPYITLEGTVEDWEDILKRLEKLKAFELGWWYEMLEPIIGEFVAARKGNPNIEFWKTICHYSKGSGTPFISGWITAFAVFDDDGTEKRREGSATDTPWISKVPSGIVNVEVKIDDNGTTNWSTMFAGQMAYEIVEWGYGLRPQNGWAICLKPEKTKESSQSFPFM